MAKGGLSLRYVHYMDMNAFVNELDGVLRVFDEKQDEEYRFRIYNIARTGNSTSTG